MTSYPGYVASALKAVRRTLKQVGWPQGKVLGRYATFGPKQEIREGIGVHRLGASSTVALTWYERHYVPGVAKARVAEAVALLRDKGFPFDDRGWMKCKGD